jgi:hypothetical protein
MPGIYLTAVLTTAVAVAIFGPIIHKLRFPANERLVWLAFAVALPLQPLAFYCLRTPLDHWLVGQLGSKSSIYQLLASLYAPLTEEPAKLLPLLIAAIYRDIRPANFARYALAIGLGFAIGEMWLLARLVAQIPKYAELPFYVFGGYFGERLMVSVFHSAFVSVAFWRLRNRFILGFAGAVALHWLGNFPILLLGWNVGGLGQPTWGVIIQSWLIIYFIGALALLSYFTFGRIALGRIFYGRRHCPECQHDYDAPFLFAINFGRTRYERCPHCRHWHWTTARVTET